MWLELEAEFVVSFMHQLLCWQARLSLPQDSTFLPLIALSLQCRPRDALIIVRIAKAQLSHSRRQTFLSPNNGRLSANYMAHFPQNYQTSIDQWKQVEHQYEVKNSIGRLHKYQQNNFGGRPSSGLVVQIHQGNQRWYFCFGIWPVCEVEA